jgi:hypothetical protein
VIGAAARIRHFGGASESAVIVAVLEQGRRVQVRDESGDTAEFVLNTATARFLAADNAHGARLELLQGG